MLSAYHPEGIVFAADKHATVHTTSERYTEPTATKVLAWPDKKAVVGYVGLGTLAGLDLDEWMRIFIAGHGDFDNLEELAEKLRVKIETDFQADYPQGSDVSKLQLIIHLGGFSQNEEAAVPVMYYIHNHSGITENGYTDGKRTFEKSDEVKKYFEYWGPQRAPNPHYPNDMQTLLLDIERDGDIFLWFNNGANRVAFNLFKDAIWKILGALVQAGMLPRSGIESRIAFANFVVDVFGSFYKHHYTPSRQAVGGGVDCVYVPWPR